MNANSYNDIWVKYLVRPGITCESQFCKNKQSLKMLKTELKRLNIEMIFIHLNPVIYVLQQLCVTQLANYIAGN